MSGALLLSMETQIEVLRSRKAGYERIAYKFRCGIEQPLRPNNCLTSALLRYYERKPILTPVMIRWNV